MKSKFSTFALAGFVLCMGSAAVVEQLNNGYLFVSNASAAGVSANLSTEANMSKLIGVNIKNTDGDTVGEVKSVHTDGKGKVSNVIVSVGGFLGVGDREVAIAWTDIQVNDDGKNVVTKLSKNTLKALPEYKYKDVHLRGTVFTE